VDVVNKTMLRCRPNVDIKRGRPHWQFISQPVTHAPRKVKHWF